MKRFLVVIAALLMFTTTFAVTRAQEALTQTFTSEDGTFSLMYPADWTAMEQSGFVLLFAGDLSTAMASGNSLFIVYRPFTGSLDDAPGQVLGDMLDGDSYKGFPKTTSQINGHNAVQYSSTESGKSLGLTAIDMGNGSAVVAMQISTGDQTQTNQATLQAILASVQVVPKAGADMSSPTVTPAGVPATAPDAANPQARIALEMPNGVDHALVITDVNGQTTKIVNRAAPIDDVKWSHDGAKLAFLSQPDQDRPSDFAVFITDPEGNQVQPITQPPSPITAVAWSPDDAQLLFEVSDTATAPDNLESGIYSVNVDGSNLTKLPITLSAGSIGGAALDWSPNGKRILFTVMPDPNSTTTQLYFADADGSNVTEAPSTVDSPSAALWSPDGQHLLIAGRDGGLTVENVDGTQPVAIVDPSENWLVGGFSWSPEGTQVAFGITANKNGGKAVFLADADGTNRRTINLGQDIYTGSVSWANDAAVSAEPPTPTQPPAATTSFTATNGKVTVAAQVPTNATVSDGSSASGAQITVIGQSTVGFDATITFPLHVEGNNDPVANLASMSFSPQQTITDIRINGHRAGELDVPSDSDSSQHKVTFLVLLDENSNDLLQVDFTIPADQVDALDSTMQALVKSVTTGDAPVATIAPSAAVTEIPLVTVTSGKYTVSMRAPENWTAQPVQIPIRAEFALLETGGPNNLGGEVDFPPNVSGGTTAKTMAQSLSNAAKGTVTEFQLDGREAARLDSTDSSGNVHLDIIVKTAAGDYVQIFFYGPADAMKEEEPTLLAMAASLITGDPNAQPAALPTTAGSTTPTTDAGSGAAAVSCSVTANGTANLRSGPGTSFAKAGSLAAGASQPVTGQVTGGDGKVWYQLDGGSYVRSDLVKADGDCASVPTVSP